MANNWNKAGRKPSKPAEQYIDDDNSPWTKEELSIITATKYSSISMLAIAVVKQWILDGKPTSEWSGVKPWINIIQDMCAEKNQNNLPSLSCNVYPRTTFAEQEHRYES